MPIHVIKLIDQYEVARDTKVFVFEKPSGLQFKSGQYGGFTLINPPETDANGITRRFSILSAPDDNFLAFATRIQNSAYKRVLNTLKNGSEIKFAGPTGEFILHESESIPAILIAGGIGISPFYSMIHHATNHQSNHPILLFYGNRNLEDAAFFPELIKLQQQNSHFKFIPTFDQPSANWNGESGFITHTMIKKYVTDLETPIFYVCGSPNMVTAIQELLIEMSIPEDHIKIEDFPGY